MLFTDLFSDCLHAGAELYIPNVQQSDAGVYVCTCRDQRSSNRSRAEIVVTSAYGLTASLPDCWRTLN